MINNIYRSDTQIAVIHICIGIFSLIGYNYLGEFFKILISPYVFYIAWSEKPKYIPALLIQVAAGTMISVLVLLIYFLKVIKYHSRLANELGKLIIFALILPAPVLIFQTILRLYLGYSIVDSFQPTIYYLGLFPFFYFVSIKDKIDNFIIHRIIIALILLFLATIFFNLENIRINSFTTSFFLILWLLLFFSNIYKQLDIWLKLGLLLIFTSLFIGFVDLKFHIIFIIILATITAIIKKKNKLFLLNFFVSKKIILLASLLVFLIIYNIYDYRLSSYFYERETFSYENIFSYPDFIIYKAFGDRGLIWSGVWESISTNVEIIPPLLIKNLIFKSFRGVEIEVTYGAHNIAFELIRYYGLLLGLINLIVYIYILVKLSTLFYYPHKSFIITILIALTFSTGLVIGITGMYVLMLNYSLLQTGFAGILYALVTKKSNQ